MAKCKWCGSLFNKKHNREEYCCEEHRKYARQEQNRKNRRNFYHKWKKEGTLSIKQQTGGLGTGSLSMHMKKTTNRDFKTEHNKIKEELKRLNLEKIRMIRIY